jgi:hypothetical protein
MGNDKPSPKLVAAWDEFARLMDGEFASLMQMDAPGHIESAYLTSVRDANRAAQLMPDVNEVFSRSRAFMKGLMTITRKPLASFKYDGLSVGQAQIRYDYDVKQLPNWKGPKTIDILSTWTGFDGLLGMTLGTTAAAQMRQLVDSARHGKDTLLLDIAARAALDEARAVKDSVWMRFDFSRQPDATAATAQLPTMNMGVGFGPHQARLRVVF